MNWFPQALVPLVVFGLIYWGMDHALVRWTGLKRPWNWVVRIAFAVLVAGGILALTVGRSVDDMARWRPLTVAGLIGGGCLFYLGLGVAALAIVNAVWHPVEWLLGRRRPREEDAPKPVTLRRRVLRWAVPAVAVVAAVTTTLGAVAFQRPEVNEVEVFSADLPAQFDGLRVALISDIHLGPGVSGDFVERMVDQVNAAQPDLIAIAGDLVDGSVAQLGPELTALARLEAPYGVVLVTGNHEFFSGDVDQWLDYWRAQGITVLDNSGIQLTRQGATIDVLGINDVHGTGAHTDDLAAAAETLKDAFGVPVSGEGRFRLLLAHQPIQATTAGDEPVRYGVDLQLSGHTHGGQMWPFHYAVAATQPMLDGLATINGVQVVTSRGVGGWGPPIRVLADPEIVLITLRQ
jgi:predicted MPP superfamily phosphohydrolase